MGTRHLIAVKANGAYRIAQYGQWDGYPTGQGAAVLSFLRKKSLPKFKEKCLKTQFISDGELKALWIECGASPNSDFVNMDVANKFKSLYPQLSRDAGSTVLEMVYSSPDGIKLQDSINFAGDSLFCEWAYVIDFDKETFEVFKGFNTKKLDKNERFYSSPRDGKEYYPVSLAKTYSLKSLPTLKNFLKHMEKIDD